jgi:hypothetical protein
MTKMETETQSNSEAPDGASTPIPAPAQAGVRGEEVMTRAEARKLIDQRQTLKARVAELEARLDQTKKPRPSTPETAANEPPAWQSAIEKLTEQVGALGSKFEQHQTTAAQTAVEAKVLSEVPDGNHATAKALLGVLGVDFTQPSAAADALAKLREHHPTVMIDPSRVQRPLAPAAKPDGSPDFSAFKSFDEVPDAYKRQALRDPDTMKRFRAGFAGGTGREDGHLI